MKIDTSQPRIPLGRLKHPLRQSPPEKENQAECIDVRPDRLKDFEREVIRDCAKRFEEWLSEIGVK